MKKTGLMVVVMMIALTINTNAFASDWDKAGKALTIIEGIRVLTGGSIDLIGNLTGINRRDDRSRYVERRETRVTSHQHCSTRVWVPHMVWKKKYVPRHEEYDSKRGCTVIVEGHYITYQAEDGGHWEYVCNCGNKCGHHKNYSSNKKYRR